MLVYEHFSSSQVKHDECLRYHAEIVRLSALLDQIKPSNTHPQIHQSSDENKNVDAMVFILNGSFMFCFFALALIFISHLIDALFPFQKGYTSWRSN